jgi:hypothetical protein
MSLIKDQKRRRAKGVLLGLALLMSLSTSISAKSSDSIWVGEWKLTDVSTNKVVSTFTLKKSDSGLVGDYTLTEDFCQARCPFKGQQGEFQSVQASPNMLFALGPDPYYEAGTFGISLTSYDGKTISISMIVADQGELNMTVKASKKG